MKKKLLTIMLAFILIISFAGCGAEDNSVVEDPYVSFSVYMPEDVGVPTLEVTHDDEGGVWVEETDSVGWPMAKGTVIGDVLTEWQITSIEPKLEGYEFEGWLEYRIYPENPKDEFTNFIYVEVSEKVYTTEEVLQKSVELDDQITYFTKWSGFTVQEYEDALTMFNDL